MDLNQTEARVQNYLGFISLPSTLGLLESDSVTEQVFRPWIYKKVAPWFKELSWQYNDS